MRILLLLIILATSCYTQANTAITKPIIDLFDAMRAHDGTKLKAQFLDSAMLQRAKADGSVVTNDVAKFANNITKTSKYLDEHLLAINVLQSDNLATVWTPYAFYLDEKLSHCGVNSFQLIQIGKEWKIQYLIDNAHSGDCKAFIKRHKKSG